MIIKKLTLHNFGVYAGNNTFEFVCDKPIILIGGMNGHGKTTFLAAILLALYGVNSIAYNESGYKSYSQYLRAYVNRNHLNQVCYVELTFEVNDFEHAVYLIRREWDCLSKRTTERIIVKKDGIESEFLSENWAMFVENILPSALSGFFFFDGEKIADMALDHSDNQIKESIRAMLGITVLDILGEDLRKSVKKLSKIEIGKEEYGIVTQLRNEKDIEIKKANELGVSIEKHNDIVGQINSKLNNLQRQYIARGGKVFEQKTQLNLERSQLIIECDSVEEQLHNLAATELPLIMVRDLITKIKLQAEDEHDEAVIQQAIPLIDNLLHEFGLSNEGDLSAEKKFVDYIKQNASKDVSEPIYRLSDTALFQANSLVEDQMDKAIERVDMVLDEKKRLKHKIDELNGYLSVDVNEKEINDISEKIQSMKCSIISENAHINVLEDERIAIQSRINSLTSELNHAIEKYLLQSETRDEIDRNIQYSNMAMHVLDEYSIALQKRKTDILSTTISSCFEKLSNKKNLINNIQIDAETLSTRCVSKSGREISRRLLSAGEKQLIVISILWALAICSRKKLPVIIDTPLSRLDSLHREALVTRYFPNASEQTIILSTDSEINKYYYGLMKKYVGDEFKLNYNEQTKSTTINKGYF